MGRLSLLAALLALAACQSPARRALVLDLNLTDPVALSGTAEPWVTGGYRVEYRRFYPHVTRLDPKQYRVLLLLGGFAPQGASDAIRPSDLAALSEWIRSGGIVVLGYATGREGGLDRWLMTRWLTAMGTGIAIGDQPLPEAPWVTAQGDAPVRDVPLAAFPAGSHHALTVADRHAVLAQAGGSPVIAAARLGDGLIIVTSRQALAALGPDVRAAAGPLLPAADVQRTRNYLAALIRWTRRPAEWARVPPVRRAKEFDLTGAPRPVSSVPTRKEPPAGVTAVSLEPASRDVRLTTPPNWARGQGVRVLHDDRLLQRVTVSGVRARTLDSLVGFLEAAGLTALWARAGVGAVAESARFQNWEREAIRNAWQDLTERLQTTSIRWMPGIDLAEARLPRDSVTVELDALGDTAGRWAALEPRLWGELLRLSVRTVARLASEAPEVIPSIVLDLGHYGMAAGFSDTTFRAGLAGVPGDSAWKAALLALPAAARYDSLLESGRLGPFFEALENATAQRAAALRTEARRFSRHVGFAMRSTSAPTDWFSIGVLRGLTDSTSAPLVFTDDPSAGVLLTRLRERGITALPVVRLDPGTMSLRSWGRLGGVAFVENGGFWLDVPEASQDSLAPLIRGVTREARLPEGTGRR